MAASQQKKAGEGQVDSKKEEAKKVQTEESKGEAVKPAKISASAQ